MEAGARPPPAPGRQVDVRARPPPAALDSAIRLLDQPLAVQSLGDILETGRVSEGKINGWNNSIGGVSGTAFKTGWRQREEVRLRQTRLTRSFGGQPSRPLTDAACQPKPRAQRAIGEGWR